MLLLIYESGKIVADRRAGGRKWKALQEILTDLKKCFSDFTQIGLLRYHGQSGPFQTKIDLLPQMDRTWRMCSRPKNNFLFEMVEKGPK